MGFFGPDDLPKDSGGGTFLPADHPEAAFVNPEDKVGQFTGKVSLAAQRGLKKLGVSDSTAEGVGKAIEDVGPHSVMDAVMTGLTVLPGAAEALPAAAEAAPVVGKAVSMLRAPGMSGALARTGLMAGAGALAGKATGEATGLEGAAMGAGQGLAAELPSGLARRATGLRVAEGAASNLAAQEGAEKGVEAAAGVGMGMSRGRAAELARPTNVGAESGAMELSAGKKSLVEKREQALREAGEKYNPIFERINEMPVEATHLHDISKAATQAVDTAYSRNQRLSRSTHDILSELEMYHPGVKAKSGLEPLIETEPEMPGGGTFKISARPSTTFVDVGGGGKPIKGFTVRPRNVQEMRGMMTRIMTEANRATSTAADRSALFEASKPIRKFLDSVIPDEQKPLLAQINAQYAQVNKMFPFKDVRLLNSAATLPELGELAFGRIKPSATSMALARMNEPQKDLMRQAFASWMLHDNPSAPELLKRIEGQQANMAALGFPDGLNKVGDWYEAARAQRRFAHEPGSTEEKAFVDAFRRRMRDNGMTPQVGDVMDEALKKGASGNMPYLIRYASTWGALGALGGWGIFAHEPMAVVPLGAYAASSLGLRAILRNPASATLYRQFITNGWTRAGGDAFARLMVAGAGNFARQVMKDRLRPDKEEEAEARP